VPFAGYEMPLQFQAGIIKEHLHTRTAAGLFDVSHMGQIVLRPRSGGPDTVARALECLVPQDLIDLPAGRQRYCFFTNDAGGILDDLIVANLGDHFRLIVNAARKAQDTAYLRAMLDQSCVVENQEEQGLLALQGPQAEAVLERLSAGVARMNFMDVREVRVMGTPCVVSRSGYTGEDGFEISVPFADIARLTRLFLQNQAVALVGLGARDSLRIEAGLCLYGADLDTTTTPIEADLTWSINSSRRAGGTREGGFPGRDTVLHQLATGTQRRRIGLRGLDRTPIRGGSRLFGGEHDDAPVGYVTSGTFGPTVGGPVAIGYAPPQNAPTGGFLFAEVRDRRLRVRVSPLPFVPHRYKRVHRIRKRLTDVEIHQRS
jgi:aminomethyltransferase